MQTPAARGLSASFRDPAGFVFSSEGEIRRAVTALGAPDYECLTGCGLGAELTGDKPLPAHEEVHHLRWKEHIPFGMMADFFARLGKRLLVKWVGPNDEMARAMLAARKTPRRDSEPGAFPRAFSEWFCPSEQMPVVEMDRTLLVLECLDSTKA